MKIGLTEIVKVTAQAKCYFDKTFANPYSNIKVRIYLKEKIRHPSYCQASPPVIEFTTGICWGHYGPDECKNVIGEFLRRILAVTNIMTIYNQTWWNELKVKCSYYQGVNHLNWKL